jgi:AbrB family looped-hinge helix DNA binding protein
VKVEYGERRPEEQVMAMASNRRLVRVEVDGQISLPMDVRGRLGLNPGDLISVVDTEDGILILPAAAVAARDIDRLEAELRAQGLSLEELIESGREIRGELLAERHERDG